MSSGTVSSKNLTSLYSNTTDFTSGVVNSSVYSVNGGTGVTVSPTTGNVLVSIGQDVATTANPTFAGATLGNVTVGIDTNQTITTVFGELQLSSFSNSINLASVIALNTNTASFDLLVQPTTVNAFTAATTLNLGAVTGTTNINNNLLVEGTGTFTGDVTATGGDFGNITIGVNTDNTISTSSGNLILKSAGGEIDTDDTTIISTNSSSFLLLNFPTTVTAFDSATTLTMGETTGNTFIRNTLNTPGADIGNITIGIADDNTITTTSGDLDITALSPNAVNISSGTTEPTRITRNSASTNIAVRSLALAVQSSGTPAAGFGNSLEYEIETAVGNTERAGFVAVNSTNVTPGSEDFVMLFGLMTGGVAADTKMTLDNSGNVVLDGNLTANGGFVQTDYVVADQLRAQNQTITTTTATGKASVQLGETVTYPDGYATIVVNSNQWNFIDDGRSQFPGDITTPSLTLDGAVSGLSTFTADPNGSSLSYVLPGAAGSANTVLTNDGSGNLTWALPGGGGSTFGNITVGVDTDNTISTTSGDLDITATGTNGVNITSGSDGPTLISRTSTPTNTNIRSLALSSKTSGTPATGIGNNLEFQVETAVGVDTAGGYLSVTSTDITPGSEDFKMSFGLMEAGATYSEKASLSSAGDFAIDGDLTVGGNDINSSSATAITLSGANATVLGILFNDDIRAPVDNVRISSGPTAKADFSLNEDLSSPDGIAIIRVNSNQWNFLDNGNAQFPGDIDVQSVTFDGATSGFSTFTAPATGSSLAYVLPGAAGANNSVLTNDGSGNLTWALPGGGGSTFGNVSIGVDTDQTISTLSGNLVLQTAAGVDAGTMTLTAGANGAITLAPNGTGNVVNTFSNGGNITNNRNYVHGAIRNATTQTTNGDIWELNTSAAQSATNPYFRGLSLDNSADTTRGPGNLMRSYSGGAVSGSASRGRLIFEKARGTAASPTAVQSADVLGSIDATGYTSTGWLNDTVPAVTGTTTFAASENWVSNTNLGTQFNVALAPTATTISSGANLIPVLAVSPQLSASRSDAFLWSNGKTGTTQTMSLDVSGNLIVTGDVRINGNNIQGSGGLAAIDLTSANTLTTVRANTTLFQTAANVDYASINATGSEFTCTGITNFVRTGTVNGIQPPFKAQYKNTTNTDSTNGDGTQILLSTAGSVTQNNIARFDATYITGGNHQFGIAVSSDNFSAVTNSTLRATRDKTIILTTPAAGGTSATTAEFTQLATTIKSDALTLQDAAGAALVGGKISYGRQYIEAYSTQDQTNPVINTENLMSFNNTGISNGISIVTNGTTLTRITMANAGVYNIQFSAQLNHPNPGAHNAFIWLKKNGANVANSAGDTRLRGNGERIMAAWNYVVSAAAGDYYELAWSSDGIDVLLDYIAASAPVPAVPSVILTVVPVGA